MKFNELQQKMQLAKSANKMVSYSSRSAEDILDKFKSLDSGWILTMSDEIVHIGEVDYYKSVAHCQKETEVYTASHMQVLSEPPLSKQGKPTMSLPQWFGAVSSYARKYALQGLFAMGEADFDQMPSEVTTQQQPKPKAAKAWSTAELVTMAMKATGEPESTFKGMSQAEIKAEVQRIKEVKNIK